MNNDIAGVCAQETCNECLHPTSSKARPRVRRKARRRKKKLESEPSDEEESVPRMFRLRGRATGRNSSNTIANERGKLDSATFFRYFTHIWNDFPKEKLESVTYFDPLWFELYSRENNRRMVLKLIKEKGVFLKKYVFVPIIVWSHWSLLIFCNLGEAFVGSEINAPCMLLLDSLHSIGPVRLEPSIRRLLYDMYASEDRPETKQQLKKMRLLIPKVPQQKKGDECGFYVLYFIKRFLESSSESFVTSGGYPYFMKKDWFGVEEVESFCKSLEALYPDDDSTSSGDSSDCVQLVGCPSVHIT